METQKTAELVMLEGICAVFSQNQLITAMKLALSVISETAIDSRGDLLQVETAIHLLTKIVPIFGEAIRSDWSELVSTLLPFLVSTFPSLQTAVHRLCLVVCSTDVSLLGDLCFQCSAQLQAQMDPIAADPTKKVPIFGAHKA